MKPAWPVVKTAAVGKAAWRGRDLTLGRRGTSQKHTGVGGKGLAEKEMLEALSGSHATTTLARAGVLPAVWAGRVASYADRGVFPRSSC